VDAPFADWAFGASGSDVWRVGRVSECVVYRGADPGAGDVEQIGVVAGEDGEFLAIGGQHFPFQSVRDAGRTRCEDGQVQSGGQVGVDQGGRVGHRHGGAGLGFPPNRCAVSGISGVRAGDQQDTALGVERAEVGLGEEILSVTIGQGAQINVVGCHRSSGQVALVVEQLLGVRRSALLPASVVTGEPFVDASASPHGFRAAGALSGETVNGLQAVPVRTVRVAAKVAGGHFDQCRLARHCLQQASDRGGCRAAAHERTTGAVWSGGNPPVADHGQEPVLMQRYISAGQRRGVEPAQAGAPAAGCANLEHLDEGGRRIAGFLALFCQGVRRQRRPAGGVCVHGPRGTGSQTP